MFNQATVRQDMYDPSAYAITIPAEAKVGAVEIREPRKSGRATSVIYTIAGLVPAAVPNPVKIRPANKVYTFVAVAIRIQPMMHGIADSLIVLRRPMYSIRNPENIHPTGTARTTIDATQDDWVDVRMRSLSGNSHCGIKMAEKASEIPITMWKEAAMTAANAYIVKEILSVNISLSINTLLDLLEVMQSLSYWVHSC